MILSVQVSCFTPPPITVQVLASGSVLFFCPLNFFLVQPLGKNAEISHFKLRLIRVGLIPVNLGSGFYLIAIHVCMLINLLP